jgi:hypothetical protein
MTDSWGDGWNGASVDVYVGGNLILDDARCTGSSTNTNFTASDGDFIELVWTSGQYDSEIGWSVSDGGGNQIGSGAFNNPGGFLGACPVVPCHDNGVIADGETLEFTINDTGGDGTCCGYGENGSISVCINNSRTSYQGAGAGSSFSIALSPGDDYSVSWVDVSTNYAYEHSYIVSMDGVVIFA